MPHPPYSPYLTLSNVFWLPWMKNVIKGKHFANEEEMKQKNGRNTERHQNRQGQNCFEQWKNVSIGVLHQMDSTLKVTEV